MLIGQIIGGKYRVTERLGVGGMGTVFEAQHTGTGGKVAVKIIIGAQVKDEAVVRFEREARAAGSVDSRHIIRVFDVGTDEPTGLPYMVMERLAGEDLSSLVRRLGPINPDLALRITTQALLGLAKAHEAGVVHRDIKPANIYLANGDQGEVVVKILDFGIAKVKMDQLQGGSDEGALTRTGSMLGSPHYMSPEQAQGLKSIDHRTDIWSMGVVLYKMLTGRTPHQNLEALGQVILAICSQPARPVQEVAPWVEKEIAAAVHEALKSEPQDRYQTSEAMIERIRPLLVDGMAIRTDMFVPLTDAQRAVVAVPLAMTGGQRNTLNLTIGESDGQNGTDAGLANSTISVRKTSKVPVFLGIAAVAIAAAVGAKTFLVKPPPPVVVQNPTNPTPTQAPASAPIVVAAPVAPKKITATLKINPPSSTVEVDGVVTAIKGDGIDLTGEPGSSFFVRAYKGSPYGKATAVFIRDDGKLYPDQVEASVPNSGGSRSRPVSGGPPAAGAAPAAAAAATPPAQKGGIKASTSMD